MYLYATTNNSQIFKILDYNNGKLLEIIIINHILKCILPSLIMSLGIMLGKIKQNIDKSKKHFPQMDTM